MFNLRLSAQYLCASVLSLMFAVGTASAQNNQKVNPPLQPGETVTNYKSSADGKFAVFTVSKVENYTPVSSRLYSFNLTTNTLRALTPALPADRSIEQYEIAPNNSRVVYRADQIVDNRFDVYSIPVAGGTATRISGFASNQADATDFKISPDSSRVVYKYYFSPEDGDSIETLVSVAIAGGTNTRIAPAQPGAYLNDFFFAPDGSRVAFQFEPSDSPAGFYSVAATGGAIALLTNNYSGNSYAISPDSQAFVYVADFEDDYVFELYSTPIKGGARTKLSQANEDVQGFKFTPPYSAAVYAYKLASDSNIYNPNSFGIVSLDARYRYNISAGKEFSSYDWQVSPDNRGIVFTAEEIGSQGYYQNELYSITLDSRGAVRKLSDSPLTPRGVNSFKISPDGSRVIFLAPPANGLASQLFSVPTIDGGVIRISNVAYNTADPYSGVQNRFEFSGDGKRVVFAYTPEIATTGVDLLSVAIAGGTVNKTAANVDNDFNNYFRIAGSSNRVLYTRTAYSFNEETFYTTTTTELFASAIR